MAVKFTCPYCYEVHTVDQCGIKCNFTVPGSDKTCRFNYPKDDEGYVANKFKGKCLKCAGVKTMMFCPNMEKEIPREFLEHEGLPIALIGAKASGKSNYIGVLVNSVRRKMMSPFNSSLQICASEETYRYYKEYYEKPLFDDGYVVEATDAGEIPPLIFPLQFIGKNGKIAKVATLTFYDTAGENLDSTEDMDKYNRYMANSKGIILLLDPLQVPSIRKHLQGKMALPEINTDAVEILSRVVQNIRNTRKVKGQIDIPVALVFTKIDALDKFDVLSPDSCLRDDSEHIRRGAFVLSEFENTDFEMRAILDNWLDEEIVQLLKNFSKSAFFGLTALGDVPTGNRISGANIRPRRELDPLLWLLAENKYIPKVK